MASQGEVVVELDEVPVDPSVDVVVDFGRVVIVVVVVGMLAVVVVVDPKGPVVLEPEGAEGDFGVVVPVLCGRVVVVVVLVVVVVEALMAPGTK